MYHHKWGKHETWEGERWFRHTIPVGKASSITSKAWLSITCVGGCRLVVYFQHRERGSDAAPPGTRNHVDWTIKNADREWIEIPDGTEFLDYCIDSPKGAGDFCIEMQAK